MARLLLFLARRTGAGFRRLLATVIGGLYLIALYGLTVWLVVGSLTAIQIRDELRRVDGEPTFSDVGRAYRSYTQREDALLEVWYNATSLFSARTEINNKIAQTLDEIKGLTAPDSPLSTDDFYESPEFVGLTYECSNSGQLNVTDACVLLESYHRLAEEDIQNERRIDSTDFDQVWVAAMKQASDLRAGEKLAQHFDTYEFFVFTPRLYYEHFMKVPPQILVLQLTIIMGMLGSVITMTWAFIKRDGDFTLRRFIILPFVGSMSAFIIFVFIKAGQLTLSAGSVAEPLNPFVLSFIGIISGLLSERAYARMAQVGSQFFRTDDEAPRYGIRLREALDAAGVSRQELAAYLQVSDEDTGNIIDGKASADAAQQQLIAACLRRDIRELFTDLPPRSAVVAQPTPPPTAGAMA